ncbi:MAG: hypothetical protein P4M09_24825 [Devosia sp.]|nr:hypothetical protein [Devosia sp.]
MTSFLDLADNLLGVAVMAGVPAYLLLQVWTAIELPRAWRLAALLPLVVATALILVGIEAMTGHAALYLAPLLIIFAPAADIYLLAVLGVRRLVTPESR